jgi:hypothetical protein
MLGFKCWEFRKKNDLKSEMSWGFHDCHMVIDWDFTWLKISASWDMTKRFKMQ